MHRFSQMERSVSPLTSLISEAPAGANLIIWLCLSMGCLFQRDEADCLSPRLAGLLKECHPTKAKLSLSNAFPVYEILARCVRRLLAGETSIRLVCA